MVILFIVNQSLTISLVGFGGMGKSEERFQESLHKVSLDKAV